MSLHIAVKLFDYRCRCSWLLLLSSKSYVRSYVWYVLHMFERIPIRLSLLDAIINLFQYPQQGCFLDQFVTRCAFEVLCTYMYADRLLYCCCVARHTWFILLCPHHRLLFWCTCVVINNLAMIGYLYFGISNLHIKQIIPHIILCTHVRHLQCFVAIGLFRMAPQRRYLEEKTP